MQQIYRRTPMPKYDFNKVTLQLYWSRTSAWMFSCKFAAYFQITFIKKEILPQVFSCEFCKISKNIFSNRAPPVAAFEIMKIVKLIILQRNFPTEVTRSRDSDHYAINVNIKVYKQLLRDVGAVKNTSSKHLQIGSKIRTMSAVQVFSTELHP